MNRFILILLLLSSAIITKAAVIKGTVTDKQTNEALIGATIQVDGTTTGTITDMDGNFEIAGLKNGTYKLIISYVSYRTAVSIVDVKGVSNIEIKLESDTEQLGEVIITADIS